MQKKLQNLCKKRDLCEIYSNVDDTSKFMVGYILSCNDNDIVLWLIDQYGHFDGICWLIMDEIYKIKTETKYLKACQKLIEYNNEQNVFDINESSLKDMLKFAYDNKRICEIELSESDQVNDSGYIAEILSDKIIIKSVDEYGEFNGESIIDIDMISCLIFDSQDMCKLEILNKSNKK